MRASEILVSLITTMPTQPKQFPINFDDENDEYDDENGDNFDAYDDDKPTGQVSTPLNGQCHV